MASIESRGRSWRALVRRKGAPHLSYTHPQREVAERWGRDAEAAIRAGKLGEFLAARTAAGTTLADLLDLYTEHVTPTKRSAASERCRIAALTSSRLGRLSLANLSTRAIREHRDSRLKSVSGSTWNRERPLLSAALKWARAERDYAVDPAILAGLGRPENPARERRLAPGN